MLAIISPAKTLDFESAVKNFPVSQPHFTDYSEQLIEVCRKLSPQDLSSLMSISDKLAGLNVARFAEWTKIHNENNSRAALFAFKGDVYTGLDADSLSEGLTEYWCCEVSRLFKAIIANSNPLANCCCLNAGIMLLRMISPARASVTFSSSP